MKNEMLFLGIELLAYYYLNLPLFIVVTLISGIAYSLTELRYSLVLLPLYFITFIQGRKFNVLTDIKEIKRIMKITDKGRGIEELFATPAWSPILSIESTNGPVWEILRNNYITMANFAPSENKLGQIAKSEALEIINKGQIIDGEVISTTTVKIFLKWLFCENHLPLDMEKEKREEHPCDFTFIDKYLNEDLLKLLYTASIEWRKHIAVKGDGCLQTKKNCINSITKILKDSKFKGVFDDWDKDVNFSAVMQPMIISPMINMSDIAVSLKNNRGEYNKQNYKNFLDFVDMNIAKNHPFPVLERYEEATNTMHYIELNVNKAVIEQGLLNFGMGPRACLGRVFARKFLENFFEGMIDKTDIYRPDVNHLYSGRDNDDNVSLLEGLYQFKILIKVLLSEFSYQRSLKTQAKN